MRRLVGKMSAGIPLIADAPTSCQGCAEPLSHDGPHPDESLYLHVALVAHGVEAGHAKVQQIVDKLWRRHGLVTSGEPREPGYRVIVWTSVAKRVRSSVRRGSGALGVSRERLPNHHQCP